MGSTNCHQEKEENKSNRTHIPIRLVNVNQGYKLGFEHIIKTPITMDLNSVPFSAKRIDVSEICTPNNTYFNDDLFHMYYVDDSSIHIYCIINSEKYYLCKYGKSGICFDNDESKGVLFQISLQSNELMTNDYNEFGNECTSYLTMDAMRHGLFLMLNVASKIEVHQQQLQYN
jgi:hypothetical protein